MLEEEVNAGSNLFFGGSFIWIFFIILLIILICPFIFRPCGPCF